MTDLHEGSKQKLSTLAMLVDCLMKYEGLSTTRELCERTGKTDSHIRKARREIAERSNVTGQIAPAVKYDRSNMTETGQIAPAELSPSPPKKERSPLHPPKEKTTPPPPASKTLPDGRSKKPALGKLDALRAFERWNALALELALPQARTMTASLERSILARIREHGPDSWDEALENVRKSAFCQGRNDRGWRMSIHSLVQAKTFAKAHGGDYGNGAHAEAKPSDLVSDFFASKRAREARYVGTN